MRDPMSVAAGLIEDARQRHETFLLEPDAFQLLEDAGIQCPRPLFARDMAAAALLDYASLGSERLVVKVVSPAIAHKSEVGGVAFVANDPVAIVAGVARVWRIAGRGLFDQRMRVVRQRARRRVARRPQMDRRVRPGDHRRRRRHRHRIPCGGADQRS